VEKYKTSNYFLWDPGFCVMQWSYHGCDHTKRTMFTVFYLIFLSHFVRSYIGIYQWHLLRQTWYYFILKRSEWKELWILSNVQRIVIDQASRNQLNFATRIISRPSWLTQRWRFGLWVHCSLGNSNLFVAFPHFHQTRTVMILSKPTISRFSFIVAYI
jgi:hypothetical protein